MKLLAILLLLPSLALAKKDYGSITPSEIRSVYDGDTFTVSIDDWPPIIGDKIKVRVAGIDTPEIRGKCQREKELARAAKQHTVSFLREGKKVELRNIKRGKYFRIVADVYVDGRSLTKSLADAGLGYLYAGGGKQSWCKN